MHLKEKIHEWRAREAEPLTALYWNIFLRGMGMSMLGLFTPIFIFLIGQKTGGLVQGLRLVVVYLVIQRLLLALVTVPVAKLVNRLGFRLSVLLGSSLTIFYYLLPTVFDESVWLVIAMALVTVLSIPFYWLSRHSMLALDGTKGEWGKEMGAVQLLERGGAILAPLVGGVIAQIFGFKVLFGVGAVIIFLSSVPLFFMKHHQRDGDITIKGVFEWFTRDKRHLFLTTVGEGLDGFVMGFFWPVFVFTAVSSFEVLGGLTSAALLLSLLATFFASKVFDKKRALGGSEDEKVYWTASWLLVLSRLARAVFGSLLGLFGVDLVGKLVSPYYWVPFGGYLYSAGKKDGGLRFYVAREIFYSLAIVLGSVLVWFLAPFAWRWWGIFGLSAMGVLLTMGLAKES
jgi:MFS family permease